MKLMPASSCVLHVKKSAIHIHPFLDALNVINEYN